jgi:hypothetical protein
MSWLTGILPMTKSDPKMTRMRRIGYEAEIAKGTFIDGQPPDSSGHRVEVSGCIV